MYSDIIAIAFLDTVFEIGFIILAVAMILASIRFIKGPSVLDRIVSLDLIAGLFIGISVILALQYKQSAYLNIALCLAIIAFIATVALALYLGKAKNDD